MTLKKPSKDYQSAKAKTQNFLNQIIKEIIDSNTTKVKLTDYDIWLEFHEMINLNLEDFEESLTKEESDILNRYSIDRLCFGAFSFNTFGLYLKNNGFDL